MKLLNCTTPDELQSLIMGLLNYNFPDETLTAQLTKNYLESNIDSRKSLIQGSQRVLLIKLGVTGNMSVDIVFLNEQCLPIYATNGIPEGFKITASSIATDVLNFFGSKNSVICSI